MRIPNKGHGVGYNLTTPKIGNEKPGLIKLLSQDTVSSPSGTLGLPISHSWTTSYLHHVTPHSYVTVCISTEKMLMRSSFEAETPG